MRSLLIKVSALIMQCSPCIKSDESINSRQPGRLGLRAHARNFHNGTQLVPEYLSHHKWTFLKCCLLKAIPEDQDADTRHLPGCLGARSVLPARQGRRKAETVGKGRSTGSGSRRGQSARANVRLGPIHAYPSDVIAASGRVRSRRYDVDGKQRAQFQPSSWALTNQKPGRKRLTVTP